VTTSLIFVLGMVHFVATVAEFDKLVEESKEKLLVPKR